MMKTNKARTAALFIAAILSAVALTACSGSSSSNDDTVGNTNSTATPAAESKAETAAQTEEEATTAELKHFSIGYLPSTGHLLYFVAKEEGFFEAEGLDAELQLFDSYSLELLRGKRIAVVPLGTQDIVWRIGFREAGLDVGTDVEFVDVESGTAAFAALNNADIDGALVFTPFRAQGVNDGYVILDYSGEIEGFEKHPCCRNIAETENINADPDAYKAYLKALIQAYKFYQENQDETVEDIVKYVSVDPDIIRQETYGEHISSYPDSDKKTIVEWKDHMVDLGFFEDFDIESHVNTELYKSALDEVISEHPEDVDFYADMVTHYEEYDS